MPRRCVHLALDAVLVHDLERPLPHGRLVLTAADKGDQRLGKALHLLAGHLGLGRLICVYDDNRVTIDGSTELAYSDDVGGRFEAYGWHVEYLGEIGDDSDALETALIFFGKTMGPP